MAFSNGAGRGWSFLTNHARVLIAIARDPQIRIRDLSGCIGITERTAQTIVNDLVEAGYLVRARVGRCNAYTVQAGRQFRHPAAVGRRVEALVGLFLRQGQTRPGAQGHASCGGPR
ncbi:MarR family transcriptional regulator [Actinomadura terrae]|uniref:MarR family transcriptional regulator n=1 Tax=Actinomadura terrae TaxID=604353 RepID=UPI001FA7B46D|nr:helix-turn-helix domain-containing protein [Actinomadura terrae]